MFSSKYILGFSIITIISALISPVKTAKETKGNNLKRLHSVLILILIILMNLCVLARKYYSVGGFIGDDVWFHSKSALLIARYGTLSVLKGAKEYYFPLHHINVAMIELVTGTGIKNAVFLDGGVQGTLIVALFMYLLLIKITKDRLWSVLGTLLFLFTDFSFYWRLSPQTTSRGFFLFIVLLYAIYYMLSHSEFILKAITLFIITMFSLVISHPTTAAITLILTGAGVLVVTLYPSQKSQENKFLLSTTAIFAVSFTGYTIFATMTHGTPVLGVALQNFLNLFKATSELKIQYVHVTSSYVVLYQRLGTLALYGLFVYSLPRILELLASKELEKNQRTILFLTGVLFGSMFIGYGFPVIGLAAYLVGRVFVFMYVAILILFVLAVTMGDSRTKKVAAILVAIAFLASIVDPTFNPSNPPFFKQDFPPQATSFSQFYGADTVLHIVPSPKDITTDFWTAHAVFYWWHNSKYSIKWWLNLPVNVFDTNISKSINKSKYILLLNTYKLHSIYVSANTYGVVKVAEKIQYSYLFSKFTRNGCIIYSNGDAVLGSVSHKC